MVRVAPQRLIDPKVIETHQLAPLAKNQGLQRTICKVFPQRFTGTQIEFVFIN